ncbi:MAG: glycosyltransferase family 4 protein [Candidatus Cyclobacteriaceae bacterium M3_2C_046]
MEPSLTKAIDDKILFLGLEAFGATGGIQKFNRALIKALNDNSLNSENILTLMLYDAYPDEKYISFKNFRGYKKRKLPFIYSVLRQINKYESIIIGHIKLAGFALFLKTIFPNKKMFLITHGIEVWGEITKMEKGLLQKADHIFSVSEFTKSKLVKLHGIDQDKIHLFQNTLDPFFKVPEDFAKPEYLLKRYGIHKNDQIVFSLARLSNTEKFKGYDLVIEAIADLKKAYPSVKYILAGKADQKEKERLQQLIKTNQLDDHVILAGFIADQEITDHYLLADLFILPSKKEGFGIVFIEALSCGTPVIAGNQDGSVEALKNGELGKLVAPELPAISEALADELQKPKINPNELSAKTLKYFGFDKFCHNLVQLLNSVK